MFALSLVEKRLDMSKTGNSKSYASFTPDEKYTMACMDPAQHIFLWATLFNRMDYARMFWRSSRDHIGMFSRLGLSPQCASHTLTSVHHEYLVDF